METSGKFWPVTVRKSPETRNPVKKTNTIIGALYLLKFAGDLHLPIQQKYLNFNYL